MSFFPAHDPVLIFAIVMTTVLIAPLLAEKLRLPGIIGLIFFGIVLGPHVLNILEKDRAIDLLGKIGLLYIMFQAGLEINLDEIKRNKHLSINFGIMTFLIPLVLGTLGAFYILNMSLPASILLASMFSSHTLLTFPIVSRMGLAKKKSVTATIGGTIITDTLAFLVLATIAAIHTGQVSATFWIKLISFSLIYGGIVIILLPKITTWFFRRFFTESGVEDYVFVITALFVSAHFSHMIGLEPIIGAFLAGLTLNPLIPEKGLLMNRIQFVGNSLFIPFFLISVGMLIDPVVLFTNKSAILVSLVMIVIALLSKDLAARLFSKLAKFSKNERGLIYGMSVNQAAATLAAVLVGYNIGIFTEAILSGTIMMIVATSLVGSIMTQKYAKKIVINQKSDIHDIPSKMSLNRILIPILKEKDVAPLMDFSFLLQSKGSHEPLYPLHISLEGNNMEEKIVDGEAILAKANVRSNSNQKNSIPLNKIDSNISASILKTINEQRINKVILGWSENGPFVSSFYETTTEQLSRYCLEMILIANLIKPMNITKRLILIVPPYLYRQAGFTDTINSLKVLKNELSAEWLIVSEEETFTEIKHHFDKQKTSVDFKAVESWKTVTNLIKSIAEPTDMIIQILARKGSIAWRMSFDQLANSLYKNFPGNNLIAVYPYLYTDEHLDLSSDDTIAETSINDTFINDLIPANNIYFDMSEKNPEIAFAKIFKNSLSKNNQQVLQQIIDVLHDFPLELTQEIVLIHTRTNLVQEYQIYIAVNKTGFDIPKIDNNHKIMIILLSPIDKTTQSHLNILSQISRTVTQDRFVSSILESNNFAQFNEMCQEGKCI
jgi:Kef-type K+ transport system membrane component KefB/mannitol/fructose-specific phosphotransferase system IIA component (Ntr-type)